MLKRNLIASLIIGIVFVFSANAFGQENLKQKAKPTTNARRSSPKPKINRGKNEFILYDGMPGERKRNPRKPKSNQGNSQRKAQLDYYLFIDNVKDRKKPQANQRTANVNGNVNKPLKNNIPRQGGGTRGRTKH